MPQAVANPDKGGGKGKGGPRKVGSSAKLSGMDGGGSGAPTPGPDGAGSVGGAPDEPVKKRARVSGASG